MTHVAMRSRAGFHVPTPYVESRDGGEATALHTDVDEILHHRKREGRGLSSSAAIAQFPATI